MAARWSHCYFWIVPTLSDFYEKFSSVFEILGSFHEMNHWQRSQRSRNRHLLRLQELNFGLELVFSCLGWKKSGKEIASPNFQSCERNQQLRFTLYWRQLWYCFCSIERINSKKKSHSRRPPAPGKPKLKPKPTPSLPRCKTIYPYDATDVDELSFQPDEIIEIIKEGKIPKSASPRFCCASVILYRWPTSCLWFKHG